MTTWRSLNVTMSYHAVFVGVLAYADDIAILSPTRTGLRRLLKICSDFSFEYHVIFNPTKSQLLFFSDDGGPFLHPPLHWSGQNINVIHRATHLGHLIGINNVNDSNLETAIHTLYSRVNNLIATFGHCHSHIKYKLFKSFAMALYGCVLWNFAPRKVEKFCVTWRKCVRKIFSLPYMTHKNLLPLICNDLPVEVQLHSRFTKFIRSVLNSDNPLVLLCGQLALNGSMSNVSNNISYVCDAANVNRHGIATVKFDKINYFDGVDQRVKDNARIIGDMICFRDNGDYTLFTKLEINDILHHLCVE